MKTIQIYKYKAEYITDFDKQYFKILIRINPFYTIRINYKDILEDISTREFNISNTNLERYNSYNMMVTDEEFDALNSEDLVIADIISKILINKL